MSTHLPSSRATSLLIELCKTSPKTSSLLAPAHRQPLVAYASYEEAMHRGIRHPKLTGHPTSYLNYSFHRQYIVLQELYFFLVVPVNTTAFASTSLASEKHDKVNFHEVTFGRY